jgi:carbon monoxide dehydrogenase subunit G
MTVLRKELEVRRPLEEVFRFVGDFANTERWDPGVASARALTEGPVRVGSRYELTVVFNGRSLPMTYEVTAYDPPNRVELRGSGSAVRARDDIRFEARGEGTRILYLADLRLRGVLRLLEPLFRSRFEGTGRRAIEGMAAALDPSARIVPADPRPRGSGGPDGSTPSPS